MGADRDEHGVKSTLAALGLEVLDPMVTGEAHPERRDPIDLGAHHAARQPVGRDPVAHHPARLGARVPNLDLVSQTRQVVGGGQPGRPRADHQHSPAPAHRRGIERPSLLQRQIAEETLDAVNRHRAIEIGTVAYALTWVVTDPAVDRRERVLSRQEPPCLLVLPNLDVGHPALDVLARRAAGVTRGQQIDVHRSLAADRPST